MIQNENRRAVARERVFRDRNNPLDIFNDVKMLKRYRFTRRGCMHLIDLLAPDIQPSTNRSHAIPASLQVFTALRYYATGSYHTGTGDWHQISEASVSRIIRRVTRTLVAKRNEFIKFPCGDAILKTQQDFFALNGFPQVVSAVDGTHVWLKGKRFIKYVVQSFF